MSNSFFTIRKFLERRSQHQCQVSIICLFFLWHKLRRTIDSSHSQPLLTCTRQFGCINCSCQHISICLMLHLQVCAWCNTKVAYWLSLFRETVTRIRKAQALSCCFSVYCTAQPWMPVHAQCSNGKWLLLRVERRCVFFISKTLIISNLLICLALCALF